MDRLERPIKDDFATAKLCGQCTSIEEAVQIRGVGRSLGRSMACDVRMGFLVCKSARRFMVERSPPPL